MSLVMYKTRTDWYYAVEIGLPEHQVSIGEGPSPADAVRNLSGTQYQSADFGCRGPANSELREYFSDMGIPEEIIDCSEAEEDEAYEALEGERDE